MRAALEANPGCLRAGVGRRTIYINHKGLGGVRA
jgi:hypothetical protein